MMNRSDLETVLAALPNCDVRVNVGGFLIDVIAADHDARRDAVVLLLHPDDLREVVELIDRNGLIALPDYRPTRSKRLS